MASETDSNNLADFPHSSATIPQQASPSVQLPPMERNIDQLEVLAEKSRPKTVRTVTETPRQSNVDISEEVDDSFEPDLLVIKTLCEKFIASIKKYEQQVQSKIRSAKEQVLDYKTKLDAVNDLLSKAEAERTKFKDQFCIVEQELIAAKEREKALQEQLMKEVSLRKNAELSAASAKEQASMLEEKLSCVSESFKRKKT